MEVVLIQSQSVVLKFIVIICLSCNKINDILIQLFLLNLIFNINNINIICVFNNLSLELKVEVKLKLKVKLKDKK